MKEKRNEGQKRSIPRCFLRLLTERNELAIVQKKNVYEKYPSNKGFSNKVNNLPSF